MLLPRHHWWYSRYAYKRHVSQGVWVSCDIAPNYTARFLLIGKAGGWGLWYAPRTPSSYSSKKHFRKGTPLPDSQLQRTHSSTYRCYAIVTISRAIFRLGYISCKHFSIFARRVPERSSSYVYSCMKRLLPYQQSDTTALYFALP